MFDPHPPFKRVEADVPDPVNILDFKGRSPRPGKSYRVLVQDNAGTRWASSTHPPHPACGYFEQLFRALYVLGSLQQKSLTRAILAV